MTSVETQPEESRLITYVMACSTEAPQLGEGQRIASFKWDALSLEGPEAVRAGKDLKASRTTGSSILTGGGAGEGGSIGGAA